MTRDLQKLIVTGLVSALLGALGSFAFVWRDMAVVTAELQHLRADVALLQAFVAEDDPRAWLAAKAKIKRDRHEDQAEAAGDKP